MFNTFILSGKIIEAMQVDINTEEGVRELEAYLQILDENPHYASAILESTDQAKTTRSPIGPLGYSLKADDAPTKNYKVIQWYCSFL